MTIATPALRFSMSLAATALLFGIGGVAAQRMPDAENGRYTLSPVTNGVIRLDTRTGDVSTCTNNGTGWACYAVPDERAAMDAEIGRLQAENEKLKTELAERESSVAGKTDEALPKADSLKPSGPKVTDGERKIEIPLPSDRDMDRLMSFLQQAWQRLVETASRMQKDATGKI
jgi:hypothetical protein